METLEKCAFCPEKTAYGAHLTCLLKRAIELLDYKGVSNISDDADQVVSLYRRYFDFKRAA